MVSHRIHLHVRKFSEINLIVVFDGNGYTLTACKHRRQTHAIHDILLNSEVK